MCCGQKSVMYEALKYKDRVPTNLENLELSGNFVNLEKSGNLRYGQGIFYDVLHGSRLAAYR